MTRLRTFGSMFAAGEKENGPFAGKFVKLT